MAGNDSLYYKNFEEDISIKKDWAKKFFDTNQEILTKGVNKWCHIVDKIGESEPVVEDYMNVFTQTLTQLLNDLNYDMEIIHDKVLDKITQMLEEIEKLCKDIHKEIPNIKYENLSLIEVYNELKKKRDEYQAEMEERQQIIEKYNSQMVKLSKILGRDPNTLEISPLPSENQINDFCNNLETLEQEKSDREFRFQELKIEIINILNDLKIEPEAECIQKLLSLKKHEILITDDFMKELEASYKQLVHQMESITNEIGELKEKLTDLWNKLDVPFAERIAFDNNSVDTLKALKVEQKRLEKLKIENIRYFLQKEQNELKQWWEKCFLNHDDQVKRFSAYNSTCYNEDLLELFQLEIKKWQNFYNQHKDLYKSLEDHQKLWKEQLELEQKSNSTNRYENRGGRLLQEEKQRNRLQKQIPKLEEKLLTAAEYFKRTRGEDFLLNGDTIDTYLRNLHFQFENDKKLKLSAKKQEREQHASTVFPSPSPIGSAIKRKLLTTPQSARDLKKSRLGVSRTPKATPTPKFNVVKARRRSRTNKRRSAATKLSFNKSNKENVDTNNRKGDVSHVDYHKFETEVSKRSALRSTEVGSNLVIPQIVVLSDDD